MEINFANVSNYSNSRLLSSTSDLPKDDIVAKLSKHTNKGVLLAHLVNFKLYQKSKDIDQQNFESTSIENILRKSNSNITIDEIQQLLNHENLLFQDALPHPLKQAIIHLINDGGSEYKSFIDKLTASSTSLFKDNGIPSVEKDALISKLDVWVDEALDGEKPARLTAKSRILDTYHRNLIRLDLSGLGLTTLPSGIFKNLTNLEYLYLSNNRLSTIHHGVFNELANLKKLHLSNNQLNTIHERAFNGLTNLKELNLEHNQLTTLLDGTFDELINLSRLELSNNLLSILPDRVYNSLINLSWLHLSNNHLTELQYGVFNGLTNLEYLYLSDNRLSTIHHGVFNELANLKKMHLSNNQLNTIHERAFNGLTNLKELNLEHNQLTTLLDGTFDELINLSRLELSNNLLSSLPDRVYNSLINLSWLHLSNNQLTELQYGVFNGLTNLEYLYLSDNRLSTIHHGVFNELANLKKLHLSNNRLSTIHERAFNGLTNLKELNLEHNQLTTFLDGTFDELINLSRLELSNNLLSILPDRVYNSLINLSWLHLSNNQLTELQYGVFNGLTNLEYLYLSDNRLSTIHHGVFNELANLKKLHLSNNQLNTIHERAFNGLTNLKELNLEHNQITTLLDGIFDELINLSNLDLSNNLLSSLPDRVFDELTQLKMVDLQENRFNIEAVDQIKSSFRDSNIRIYISVYEELPLPTLHHLSFEDEFESLPPEIIIPPIITRNSISAYRASSLIETNLTLMDNLRKVFKQANSTYHLQMDWNQFEQPNIFNGFLNKINKMADTQKNPARKAIVYSNLAKIIIAMEQNPELREICFNLARESTQTCGDRVALGFIQMQIQAKLYKPYASLSELFTQQKILCALDIIFNLARNKVNSSRGIIDEVEVYLTYVKNLKDYLQVEITDILYEALSDVTQDDIENTRKCLNETLTDDYIYEALVDSEVVKIRYKDEFKVVQDQPEFDTSLQDVESDGAYKERMNNMLIKFKKEKISFLKAQLKSFGSLPPLVEGD